MTFLLNSSKVIKNLYSEIKSYCDMCGFDIDTTQYKDCIEFTVTYDSLLILSFTNKFNELELMFQLLGSIYYLNSTGFKREVLDLIHYREKIVNIEYYNILKEVGKTIFYDDSKGEWIDSTKRLKLVINKPANERFMTLEYPILYSLIHLYILP